MPRRQQTKKKKPLHEQDDLAERSSISNNDNDSDNFVPGDIDYKDQALSLRALRRGERVLHATSTTTTTAAERENEEDQDLPSDIDYKDQILPLEQLRQGQRVVERVPEEEGSSMSSPKARTVLCRAAASARAFN